MVDNKSYKSPIRIRIMYMRSTLAGWLIGPPVQYGQSKGGYGQVCVCMCVCQSVCVHAQWTSRGGCGQVCLCVYVRLPECVCACTVDKQGRLWTAVCVCVCALAG